MFYISNAGDFMTSKQTPSIRIDAERLPPLRIPGESVIYDVIDDIGREMNWLQKNEIAIVNSGIKAMQKVHRKTPEQTEMYRHKLHERRNLRGINRMLERELDLAHVLAADFLQTDIAAVGQSEIAYESALKAANQEPPAGSSIYNRVIEIIGN